jgi:hypothetical protein
MEEKIEKIEKKAYQTEFRELLEELQTSEF